MSEEYVDLKNEVKAPKYFYRVTESVTTFGKDAGKNEPIGNVTDFTDPDLLKSKLDAIRCYNEKSNGLQNGSYFLPYAGPKDFVFGENAAFSVVLSLVEYYDDDEYIEHPLKGDNEEDEAESLEIEEAVIQKFIRDQKT